MTMRLREVRRGTRMPAIWRGAVPADTLPEGPAVPHGTQGRVFVSLDGRHGMCAAVLDGFDVRLFSDDIVPESLSRRLYEAANEPKRFLEIKGPHKGLPYQEVYRRGLEKFLDEYKASAA